MLVNEWTNEAAELTTQDPRSKQQKPCIMYGPDNGQGHPEARKKKKKTSVNVSVSVERLANPPLRKSQSNWSGSPFIY